MNLDGYYDDEPTPTDELVIAYVLADFDAVIDRTRANGNGWRVDPRSAHLRDCPERFATDAALESASACSFGTCEVEPCVRIVIRCPHERRLHWSAEEPTMGELLDSIATFAGSREKQQ